MKEARAVPQQLCLEHPPARTSLEIFDSHPPSLLFLREPSVLLWMSPTPSSIPHPRCQVHLRCQAFLTQCMCMTWKKSGRLHCSSSSGRSIGIFLFLSLSLVLSLSLSLSLFSLSLSLLSPSASFSLAQFASKMNAQERTFGPHATPTVPHFVAESRTKSVKSCSYRKPLRSCGRAGKPVIRRGRLSDGGPYLRRKSTAPFFQTPSFFASWSNLPLRSSKPGSSLRGPCILRRRSFVLV